LFTTENPKDKEKETLNDSWSEESDMGDVEDVDYSDIQFLPSAFPPTYLVLRLSCHIQPAAVSWLINKITGKKQVKIHCNIIFNLNGDTVKI
jgi:hypothetical protein